jgi:hypothetical protein
MSERIKKGKKGSDRLQTLGAPQTSLYAQLPPAEEY